MNSLEMRLSLYTKMDLGLITVHLRRVEKQNQNSSFADKTLKQLSYKELINKQLSFPRKLDDLLGLFIMFYRMVIFKTTQNIQKAKKGKYIHQTRKQRDYRDKEQLKKAK